MISEAMTVPVEGSRVSLATTARQGGAADPVVMKFLVRPVLRQVRRSLEKSHPSGKWWYFSDFKSHRLNSPETSTNG